MATIYERVDALEVLVSQIQSDLDTLSGNVPDVSNLLSTSATDITDENLNSYIGKIYVGYGNGCINKPAGAGNGYFVNIPHCTAQYASLYNKQYWIERTTNRIWTRMHENGTFSDWVMIGGNESVTGSAKITNETFNGKPVYCKTVNTGNLPNNTVKEISSGLTASAITVVRIGGVVYGDGDSLQLPNPHPTAANNISCYLRNDGKICIGTGKDRTALSGFVQIYYTNN